ncbi:hypothetical protein OEA41_010132 [Lepraria neglecta]|uniref:Uncharacterized protein n=1 Tax=Lepraria neglecta TaxID=209136 RepID=A0AAE0DDJ4_9LECA|nr:hypothetical protein OEA41_010132 [Lepraria neglecta]
MSSSVPSLPVSVHNLFLFRFKILGVAEVSLKMTKVIQEAELMEQWLPAKPIADMEAFYIVYDNNRSPMVFSIGSEGKLYLIKKNAKGVNELLELSSKFNVPKNHRAVALNVTQDSQLMTCIAFATEEKGKASSLNIVLPFKPSNIDWSLADLSSWLLNPNQASFSIKRLLMGVGTIDNEHPFLAATLSVPGEMRVDIRHVAVDLKAGSWSWEQGLQYPYNAGTMTDLCFGSLPLGDGVFGLDMTQGKPAITFVTYSKSPAGLSTKIVLNLPVIPGVRSLTTSLDEEGYTNLLVGGHGILHMSAQACSDSKVTHGAVVEPTIKGDLMKGIQKLYTSQDKSFLTIWLQNSEDDILYQRFTYETQPDDQGDVLLLKPKANVVPLMSSTTGGVRFTALYNSITQSRSLFVLGKDGQITLMSQAVAIRCLIAFYAIPEACC